MLFYHLDDFSDFNIIAKALKALNVQTLHLQKEQNCCGLTPRFLPCVHGFECITSVWMHDSTIPGKLSDWIRFTLKGLQRHHKASPSLAGFSSSLVTSPSLKAQMELLQQSPSSADRANGALDTDLPIMRRRRGRRKNVEGLELLFMANKRAGAAVWMECRCFYVMLNLSRYNCVCISSGWLGGHQGLGCGGCPGVTCIPHCAWAEPEHEICCLCRFRRGRASSVQQRVGRLAQAAPNIHHGYGRIHTSGFF